MRIGGIIGGHDYGAGGQVKDAVNEIFNEADIHIEEDGVWWVRKKNAQIQK